MKKNAVYVGLVLCLFGGSYVHADTVGGMNMDFVYVGNANNANDNGYGAVGYNYRIGTTEVSIEQYMASALVPANDYDEWKGVGSDAPVANLTWHEAAAFCNWMTAQAGNSSVPYLFNGNSVTGVLSRTEMLADGGLFYVLPTEDEWYKAAYYTGSGYTDYANGSSVVPELGIGAMYDTNTVWGVGQGVTEQNHQTQNMMGNVFEWLETSVDGSLFGGNDDMVLRGGGAGFPENRLSRSYRVDGAGESTLTKDGFNSYVGVRIVAIPEPGTITLMSMSTVGLFLTRSVRRRRRFGQSIVPARKERSCDVFASEVVGTVQEAGEESAYLQLVSDCTMRAVHVWVKKYRMLEKGFWNRMVLIHERRVLKRKAFRETVKTKLSNGFDAFLAMIMK